MLKLSKLFKPVGSMDPEEAKAFMNSRAEGTYTLLDVRQPKEYEQSHLAGAKLIPLPTLDNAFSEIDPHKPTLVYCAVGGRSRVAAQLLSGRGFKEVYNITGGINAWKGSKAAGPKALNLELIQGDESPSEILAVVYALEIGLGRFYLAALEKTADQAVAHLLDQLARIEDKHQAEIISLYAALAPDDQDQEKFKSQILPAIMEGGFDIRQFLEENESAFGNIMDVLQLAMMLETQAMDLYLRLADKSTGEETRQILFKIASEEKAHLAALGRMYEQKL